jgi:hypothetical protein
MPGDRIEYGGEPQTVGAVGVTGGERYYWLVAEDGSVSMLPWFVVEPQERGE